MPMLPWLICPLAGQARLGQNVVAGSMRILLSWRCWGACQEGVCLDPHFCYKCFSPRLSVELPDESRGGFILEKLGNEVEALVHKAEAVEHHRLHRVPCSDDLHFRVLLGGL